MKHILILISIFSVYFCNDGSTIQNLSPDAANTEQPYFCTIDSLTLSYLSKTPYSEAKKTCKLTILDRDFNLEDMNYPGLYKGITSFFTKEELARKVKIKEVKWESKNQNYITVWYRQQDSMWCPFDILEYSKDTKF